MINEQDQNEKRPPETVERQSSGDERGAPVNPGEEPEFYVEPLRMGARDLAGIILALVALAIIGYSGYIWLNPTLGYRDALRLGKLQSPVSGMTQAAAPVRETVRPSGSSQEQATGAAASGGAEQSAEDATCATCGMDSLKSLSHVIATWSDGKVTHHDSWDCMFNFEKSFQKKFVSAQVRNYESPGDAPEMLAAAKAYYLYDTKETVTGSMPPYVAAFPTRADAESHRAKLGGEVVDFSRLKSKMLQGSE